MSYSGSKTLSDQGNQHNNGPHQDQIFDNPSALLGIVGQKLESGSGVGGGGD